jgi:ABC-2 type transport system ATP-binding protein
MLSSHLLAEVEEVCNRVAIIRSGRIAYEGALAELRRTAKTGYRLRVTEPVIALAVCKAQPRVAEVEFVDGGDEISFVAAERDVAELSVALVEAGVAITKLAPLQESLEDVFFRFTEGDGDKAGPSHLPSRVMDAA